MFPSEHVFCNERGETYTIVFFKWLKILKAMGCETERTLNCAANARLGGSMWGSSRARLRPDTGEQAGLTGFV